MVSAPLFMMEIEEAAARLKGHAVRTPLLRSDALDSHTGGRVFLKPECLQRTGSFKFRGAMNRLLALSPAERAAGVVAFSSGNHAQGVALAARLLGSPQAARALQTRHARLDAISFDSAHKYMVTLHELSPELFASLSAAAATGQVQVPTDSSIVRHRGNLCTAYVRRFIHKT